MNQKLTLILGLALSLAAPLSGGYSALAADAPEHARDEKLYGKWVGEVRSSDRVSIQSLYEFKKEHLVHSSRCRLLSDNTELVASIEIPYSTNGEILQYLNTEDLKKVERNKRLMCKTAASKSSKPISYRLTGTLLVLTFEDGLTDKLTPETNE